MPTYSTAISIRLTQEQREAVQQAAEHQHVSVYRWLVTAVEEKLARKEASRES